MTNNLEIRAERPNWLDMNEPSLLRELLTSQMAGGTEMIANTPALRSELQAVYPEVKAVAAPIGADGVKAALLPLLLVFGDKATEAESPMFWQMYATALEWIPARALRMAVQKWVSVGKWFPKPADLRELAEGEAVRLRAAEYRARKALEAPVPKPENHLPREAVAALVGELKASLYRMNPTREVEGVAANG